MTLLSALSMSTIQRLRRATQVGFFVLFLLAPALNLLRFDLSEAQLWFLGVRWTLGIDALRAGEIDATQAGLNLVLRALLPLVVLAGSFLWVAYRYGRLYCGWLCPHFSMVESLNNLLHRACGKQPFEAGCGTAQDRGRGEDRDAHDHHAAPTDEVAEASDADDERGDRKQVRKHHPLHLRQADRKHERDHDAGQQMPALAGAVLERREQSR